MNEQQPGWGKTIGVFFLCGCLAVGTCIITSSMMASSIGYTGYSRGGILATITGIVCAGYYRSNGKLAGPALASIVVGAILGVMAVQMALR